MAVDSSRGHVLMQSPAMDIDRGPWRYVASALLTDRDRTSASLIAKPPQFSVSENSLQSIGFDIRILPNVYPTLAKVYDRSALPQVRRLNLLDCELYDDKLAILEITDHECDPSTLSVDDFDKLHVDIRPQSGATLPTAASLQPTVSWEIRLIPVYPRCSVQHVLSPQAQQLPRYRSGAQTLSCRRN